MSAIAQRCHRIAALSGADTDGFHHLYVECDRFPGDRIVREQYRHRDLIKEAPHRQIKVSRIPTDMGAFAGEKKLAQVWLALARGQVEALEPACAPETPFAVRVQVRPPHGRQPVLGGLVKGIFDGVICAFQAHTDTAVLPEVVARLAKDLPAPPAEIEERLLDQRGAVLGAVQTLVSPYRAGVKWNPSDHMCVAGELLLAESVDEHWAVKGDVIELFR
jgi:hypothetical protein